MEQLAPAVYEVHAELRTKKRKLEIYGLMHRQMGHAYMTINAVN